MGWGRVLLLLPTYSSSSWPQAALMRPVGMGTMPMPRSYSNSEKTLPDPQWTMMTGLLRGASIAGYKMKMTHGWGSEGNGTNSSQFEGFPGGKRMAAGQFSNSRSGGYWWSSSSDGSSAWLRYLSADFDNVYRISHLQQNGFSVRCIRDVE